MKRSAKIILPILIIGTAAAAGYFYMSKRYAARMNLRQAQLAEDIQQKMVLEELQKDAEQKPAVAQNPKEPAQEQQTEKDIPAKHLLAMPFYSQAPFANWDVFHEDMCEEASLLNAGLYLTGGKLPLEEYDRELKKLKELEEKLIGEWKSNTIAELKQVSDEYFTGKVQSKVIDNPTTLQIEMEISQGRPVIVPLAGRDIGNPNYRQPGPIYHMLVVKGYEEKFFITNDVGTRKGDSYVYKKEVLMDNMHDWDEKDIHLGGKRVLVLYK